MISIFADDLQSGFDQFFLLGFTALLQTHHVVWRSGAATALLVIDSEVLSNGCPALM